MVPANAQATPGICALLGSGETTGVGRRVLSRLLPRLDEPRAVAVLDTPAGFQPNHFQVAEKMVLFLTEKLAEFRPHPTIIETRRASHKTVVEAHALALLAHARCIVAGPGSPTYMIRELVESSYLHAMRQAHTNGTALYMSSAASIALSAFALPVYEIFKVGEDPHWRTGLDFFASFGMSLAIVPHWNNQEGGAAVDTRFCYMGKTRFETLHGLLPPEVVMLGIDEYTACILDFATGHASVEGKGGVHLVRDGQFMEWSAGKTFPMSLLEAHAPTLQQENGALAMHALLHLDSLPPPATTLDPRIEEDEWATKLPPQLIDAILAVRADLRRAKHWVLADHLRDAIAAYGIVVEDTPTGSRWHVAESD